MLARATSLRIRLQSLLHQLRTYKHRPAPPSAQNPKVYPGYITKTRDTMTEILAGIAAQGATTRRVRDSLSEGEEMPPSKRVRIEIEEERMEGMEEIEEGVEGEKEPEAEGPGEKVTVNKKKMVSAAGLKKKERKRLSNLRKPPDPCSTDDILWREVVSILGQETVDKAIKEGKDTSAPLTMRQEAEVEIRMLSSTGEGIGVVTDPELPPWAVVIPLALPGEKVRARIYHSFRMYSRADLLEVITPNPELRDMSRVKCQYFGKCGGCQYQMLSYEKQLDLKRDVIVKAYKFYSNLPESLMPPIQSTTGSPLQYGYRTKLTPHFDKPKKDGIPADGSKPAWLDIGFHMVGSRKPMDIEECPIATPVINDALPGERAKIIKNIQTFKNGSTILLRDSLNADAEFDRLSEDFNKRVCVTDYKAVVRELVGDWIFEYPGGSFFQNNNSAIPLLTDYVREAIFPSPPPPSPSSLPTASSSTSTSEIPTQLPSARTCRDAPTHLVDAYCGAGLFAITLSPYFQQIAGIELSAESIRFARRNSKVNKIPYTKIDFYASDASNIFRSVTAFPADKTVVVIDPPRKGCDDKFLNQLIKFRPQTVVYVSCNVNTQARDVGKMMEMTKGEGVGKEYVLESLKGFDLFPQTAHVEGVAILRLLR